ncbi:MAG TPA: SDR family oxidoreductase [Anaerolineales bacterium]|nr:SDR family oxidoreductase [Anaerolineales bacterium]
MAFPSLLANRNALITGAGRNIGKHIALEMAAQGANVYFTDLLEDRIQKVTKQLKAYPVQSQGFISDVARREDTDQLLNTLDEQDITIDILVNNVALNKMNESIQDFTWEDWHAEFNTNLFGPLYLTRQGVARMISRGVAGSIIFLTSIHQWYVSDWPSYGASKSALGMVVKELAVDLAPNQIRVNGIAPGWVAEDDEGNALPSEYMILREESVHPRYIGRAAVYLASDYFSQATTGTVLKVDGGMSLYNHRIAQRWQRERGE